MTVLATALYAIASGSNVALANLNNVENHLHAQNRKTAGGCLYRVGIASPLLNQYPVRTRLLSGKIRGDGQIDHYWDVFLVTLGVKYLLETYLPAYIVSSAVTIYTRRHEYDTYVRANAYLNLPNPASAEIERMRGGYFRVRLPFTDVTIL